MNCEPCLDLANIKVSHERKDTNLDIWNEASKRGLDINEVWDFYEFRESKGLDVSLNAFIASIKTRVEVNENLKAYENYRKGIGPNSRYYAARRLTENRIQNRLHIEPQPEKQAEKQPQEQ